MRRSECIKDITVILNNHHPLDLSDNKEVAEEIVQYIEDYIDLLYLSLTDRIKDYYETK